MKQTTTSQLLQTVADPQSPCCSLYQPTHRSHPENQQDPIRYRNLVKQLETSLAKHPAAGSVEAMLRKFKALATDTDFWNHRTDGLAILADANRFEIFDLQRSVSEAAIVADSFHIKPLLRVLQSADRFQILCVDRQSVSLYEGNRDALDLVELHSDVPATITEALGAELTEPHLTVSSYGGTSQSMHHGQGSKTDEVDNDRDRFFRAIDRAILEHHSKPSGLPLILAALPEYHAHFRGVSKNTFLVEGGIAKDPKSLSHNALRSEAWNLLEPTYLERLADLTERFSTARSKELGSGDLSDVARATVAGRVATLLIEADCHLPGRIDSATGAIMRDDLTHPEVDDKLDDLAEMVLTRKGTVIVVPKQRMPTESGLAAIYRY